jgi:hypothetical protein
VSATPAAAQSAPDNQRPVLTIPKLGAPPRLEDFLDMQPTEDAAHGMVKVDRFVQRSPDDGQPERMKTVAYLGYTDDALHVVYLAFDPTPSEIRAHLIRREDVFAVNDDEVELRLDTFGDGRQSYYFVSNPLGVQLDASWPEFEGKYDQSFDLVWHSRGQRTSDGFVVEMAIPFKTLRFPAGEQQTWGVYVGRWIPRTGEWTFWPPISNRQQSYLAQMARVEGIRPASRPSRIQLIPYASSRAFKVLDTGSPGFIRDRIDPRAGIDAKAVIRNSLVVDATLNPDFSQVESDSPQITVNQRFEVFFPEKRPFFLENAGFFQTPVNLLFTRRIADPQVGAKLTGKAGPWTVGMLVADDEAPGKRVAAGAPARGDRAWAGVGRVSRSVRRGATVGGIVTRRTFSDRENVVGGVDGRWQIDGVWSAEGQLAASRLTAETNAADGRGSAYIASLSRTGRTVTSRTVMEGRSPDFVTALGFVPRVDVHQASHSQTLTFRPAKTLSDWGPTVLAERAWAFDGTPLDWRIRPSMAFSFERSTSATAFAEASHVTLRPGDAPNLARDTEFRPDTWGFDISTSPKPAWSASAALTFGRAINFEPPPGVPPDIGDYADARVTIGLRPFTPLRIENTWLQTALNVSNRRAFSTAIIRSQWSWQFTREWSLRFIGQYESTSADSTLSALTPRRNLNGDVLITRLLNPWTALYVGYNGNAQNVALAESDGVRLLRRTRALDLDGWQLFVKWSHLLQW